MRILLVDDEPHVLHAIRQLVPWEEIGISQVLEAGSGRAALALLEQEAPEIVMTDVVMPDLTGLELLQILRQGHPDTKVIVMSGYSDFEYVHSTLVGGGIDYLLKPLEPQQLVRTIRRAVEAWEQEEDARNAKRRDRNTLRLVSDLAVESLLERILFQDAAASVYEELIRLAPEMRDVTHCMICLIDTAYLYDTDARDAAPAPALLEQTVRRILTQKKCGYLLRHPAAPSLRIVFLCGAFSSALDALEDGLLDCNQGARFHLHFGVSPRQTFPAHTAEAYRQASEAFYAASSAQLPKPLLLWDAQMQQRRPPVDHQKEQAMLAVILSGDTEKALPAVQAWLRAAALEGQPLYYVAAVLERYRELEYGWSAQLARRYDGFALELPPLPNWPDFADSRGLLSVQRLAEVLCARLRGLHEQFQAATAGDASMQQIAHYLEENYDKPFNQEACAARFFMSRNYMCRRFSKELGVSMVSYLNGVRIRQAKLLMADRNETIRSIAHQVGFEDEKYFARQFKRIEGVSPGEYRARLLK